MNVLSLFDGISACRLALERAGHKVDNYYTAEIDKYAEKVSMIHYPDAVRLGDVTKWQEWDIDWASIDLVTGGFPCQAWSVAGKQMGDKDERGMLFWTMLDIMKQVIHKNPKAKFFIENVKMKKEFERYITHHTEQALGKVNKHLINSALVSAQNRQRYYWTNIDGIEQPQDKGILLKDIIKPGLEGEGEFEYKNIAIRSTKPNQVNAAIDAGNKQPYMQDRVFHPDGKSHAITATFGNRTNILIEPPCEPRGFNKDSLCHHVADAIDIKGHGYNKRVYAETGKAPSLAAASGGSLEPKVLQSKLTYRKLTPTECERLQTFPSCEKTIEVKICLDQAKNFVDVVNKNPKLLKLVLNAGDKELREFVNSVVTSMKQSEAPIKHTALQNADIQTQKPIKECMKNSQKIPSANTTVNSVKKTLKQSSQDLEGDSALLIAPIYLTEGKITLNGEEGLHQKGKKSKHQESIKKQLKVCGEEMMRLANAVIHGLSMENTTHSMSTTSSHLSMKNIEQILTIYYCFANHVINGFILGRMKTMNLSVVMNDGWTDGISNTQRYKALGNAWTVDVIAHCFRSINNG